MRSWGSSTDLGLMIGMHTQECPRCQRNRFTPYGEAIEFPDEASKIAWYARYAPPALSRTDDRYICSSCGQDEAMRDFTGQPPIPASEWPVVA